VTRQEKKQRKLQQRKPRKSSKNPRGNRWVRTRGKRAR
jgi:hypothetical protein